MSSATREAMRRLADDESGQATVEAAFALPVVMIMLLLLLQPGIILYDRIIMQSAAAEGCRLLETTTSSNSGTNEDYIRRRLSAIPQIDQFHVHTGGCSWDIHLEGGEGDSEVGVLISTEVKPLPILDFGMSVAGMTNSRGNIVVSVESEGRVKPEWVDGSSDGTDPAGWV